jgi:signal transduction histidine kinase
VRTPATVIFGVAKTLAEHGDSLDEGTRAKLFNAFYQASERLARLTDDLLDFTRLDARAAQLALERLSVWEVVRDATHGLSLHAEEEIRIAVPEDLSVVADRRAMEMIISNLVRNGLVHGAPPVSVTATQEDSETCISVADRGTGVAESFVSQLFEPFARPESTSGPGAGLGLAIAQSYARQLGGRVVYEPNDGAGATFTLVLPKA